MDDQLADVAFAVNVKAPALLAAALVPPMAEIGGGVVVNVGSINGAIGMAVAALYGATKAALHSLTASWAAELAPKGIRVNAVAPGPTMTEENAAFHDMLRDYAARALMVGRARPPRSLTRSYSWPAMRPRTSTA